MLLARKAVGVVALVCVLVTGSAVEATGERYECFQKIQVYNSASFFMFFEGRYGQTTHAGTTNSSGAYLFGSHTTDFAKYKVGTGHKIWPRVQALAGLRKSGPKVRYCKNGKTARYTVTGTTLFHSVLLD
ncbi:hypothetical protein [Actinokineospora terrae]|uniref:Secreted protein n=1 Tax=Actinokineospora terrae TaxID=155974 RepID=A0A1H9MHZ4_9PSEU|nr:hypothetical protein [Actinokineospora terrae]SER23149.1 hypothetical protein SAMN04487818_102165 [Actinokineospora terrae]